MAPAARRAAGHLTAWGLQARTLRCLSRGDTQVWRLTTAEAAPRDLVLRLYPGGAEQAQALDDEMGWLIELAARSWGWIHGDRMLQLLHTQRCLNTVQWMLDDGSAPGDRPWGPAFVAGLSREINGP